MTSLEFRSCVAMDLTPPTLRWYSVVMENGKLKLSRVESRQAEPSRLKEVASSDLIKLVSTKMWNEQKEHQGPLHCPPGLACVTGAPPWSQAWGWGSQARRLVAGQSLPTGPGQGSARNGDVGPPSSRLTTHSRKVHEGPVQCGLGSSRGRGPRTTQSLDQNSGNRDMECHLAGGKEPELVREVERYRLEIVGLTSTHSLGSGTQLLERGWTLHYSGVAQGERRRGWCGLAYSSPAQPPCVGVHSGEREGRFPACAFGLGIGHLLLFVPLRAEQQYRVPPGLLGVPGRGT
ncbi:hypothetical protein L3Q82_008575 [Scortum barcoo]|uniref:Uncharacterized protein n=1 Tax=Scortum barcoo TaxID=214431 RepID=A0ACB8XBA7_9TELE|nr:hypothetical protein L3Q82_008575 [Scortum barcoo]